MTCKVKYFFQPLGLHNIRYGQLLSLHNIIIVNWVRRHRPGGPAKFWEVYQLRCQILIAAARAANSESCQILKGAAAAANFRPCQISMAAAIWPAPKFYHA